MERQYDFRGWATRYNVKCSDGRTILPDAFKHYDGQEIPLIWNHDHSDPTNLLGKAYLEHRDEGLYAYGIFNDTPKGQSTKTAVLHGDLSGLSIYANRLRQYGPEHDRYVQHGELRELSLVYATANPEAFIEDVMVHSEDGSAAIVEDAGIIYSGDTIELYHSDESDNIEHSDDEKSNEKEDKKVDEEKKEKSIQEIYDGMTEEEKEVVHAMVGMAIEAQETEDEDDDEEVEHSEGGDDFMKTNVFDQQGVSEQNVLTHADQEAILETAKQTGVGSLQAAIKMFAESNESMAHGLDLGDTEVLNELLPDHKLLNPGAPEILRADQSWVMGVINKIHKSPYARIRTRKADARQAELKAKGYKKGEEKKFSDHIKLLGRKTEPTTIYLKESLHRDDIIDITDFDVVNYVWGMMKDTMYETLALAALVGDGRDDTDPDKISETNIRPIWKDEELYTIHKDVDIEAAREELQGSDTSKHFGENYIYAEAMITAALYAREKYKGTGTPDYYCAPHSVNVMLLARDLNGRRIYDSKADLARALNVNSIIEIEQIEGKTRKDEKGKTKKLHGIFVNLADYQFGSTKGGEITKFSDFDIDFNKYKYLMETRLSGALTEPESAIALEEVVEEAAG
jgi:HK97 family phage prohead protease